MAVLRGQDPEAALSALLDKALVEAEIEAETIRATLQASEDDFAAGRSMSLEEWRAGMDAKERPSAWR